MPKPAALVRQGRVETAITSVAASDVGPGPVAGCSRRTATQILRSAAGDDDAEPRIVSFTVAPRYGELADAETDDADDAGDAGREVAEADAEVDADRD